jgi:hypothetical protein
MPLAHLNSARPAWWTGAACRRQKELLNREGFKKRWAQKGKDNLSKWREKGRGKCTRKDKEEVKLR